MKKISMFAAMTALLFIAVFFCSCGKDSAGEETTEYSYSAPWSEADVFEMPEEPTQASKSEDSGKTPATTAKSEEDDSATILKRIEDAEKVYDLFCGVKPQMDKNAGVEYNGTTYYPITDPHFASMADLKAFLSLYFSDTIVNSLSASGMYAEMEDGKLYAPDMSMRMKKPDYLDKKAELVSKTDTEQKYTLTMGVDADHDGKAESTETHNFTYTYVKDAEKWVFSHFELY